MSIKMDADRISKWKCLFCGSRYKKVVHAMKNEIEQGFSVVCCECGHTDNFVSQFDAIPMYTVGLNGGRVSDLKITCGCSDYDRGTCKNRECSCRKENDTKTQPPPPHTELKKVATDEHTILRNKMLPIRQ